MQASAWEEAFDEGSGRAYYFNRLTGETAWTLPGEATPKAGGESAWQQAFDEASQTTYYYNIHTGETSWTAPEAIMDSVETDDLEYLNFAVVRLQSIYRGNKSRKRTRRVVRARYQFTPDPATGRTLYTDRERHTSSWTTPALFRPLRIPDDGGEEDEEEDDDDDDDDFDAFQRNAEQDAQDEEAAARLAEDQENEETEDTPKRQRRSFPRSKAQQLVDEAEDAGEQAQTLNLSSLGAWKLSSRVWNLQFLRTLVLSHNCLPRIPSGIQDLVLLEELDVSHNQLTRLPSCLQTTSTLAVLRASHNFIQAFSPKLWKLRGVRYLDLSHNRLKELPYVEGDLKLLRETREWQVGVGLMTGLQVLLLSHNRLTEVPKSIDKCVALMTLDLTHNQLATVSDEVGELAALERLLLSHNVLRVLPECMGRLSCLQELDVTYNRLAALPETVGTLHNLERLCLAHNQITRLPPECGSLSQLRHAELDNNAELLKLDAFFRYLPNVTHFSASGCGLLTFESLDFLKESPVETLQLRHNALSEFPVLLGHAVMQDTLQELTLEDNALTQVPLAVLLYCTQLRRLDLSRNELRVLPSEIGHLRTLEQLCLSHNALQELPDALAQLGRLRELRCDHNCLEKLPLDVGKLVCLSRLDLSFNRLRSLPTSMMELAQLRSLHASHNLLDTKPPAVASLVCFCEFSNNPFTTEQHQRHQERQTRRALATQLVNARDFGQAEALLTQLLTEVETLNFLEQQRQRPQLHSQRGLCRVMLLKAARQTIEETSTIVTDCEQRMHSAELIQLRQYQRNRKHKSRQSEKHPEASTNDTQPQSDKEEDADRRLPPVDEAVRGRYVQALEKRTQARAQHERLASGALYDLQAAIRLGGAEYPELATTHYLEGLVHSALLQYVDAITSFSKALDAVHAPSPTHTDMNNQVNEPGNPPLELPATSVHIFLQRAQAYRGLGQMPAALADVRHVLAHYPAVLTVHRDSDDVLALENDYAHGWEVLQTEFFVDDDGLLRAFDVAPESGLARRPEVLDVHAEALAAATAKKTAGRRASHHAGVSRTKPPRVPPAERFRADCAAHKQQLEMTNRQARDVFHAQLAKSRVFLARARDFKREIRAGLQMEMEEAQQRAVERERARLAELRRLELQREVDERLTMKYEDELTRWIVSEQARLEAERLRRLDEAQRKADAKAAYAIRLSRRGGKRQQMSSQRGKSSKRK